ncbi:MAG: 3',5'-cyclic-nucleotide phosphodiesterase [Acidobacteriota bacterium]|nr:3',5'-cyclic-nucleotide phosphodiesterase [Acidobacteriota bacterium]MDH3529777.1 3',5'-cyclic-nucleotide phosphodiesterase [Acidobacteriota bacterium]
MKIELLPSTIEGGKVVNKQHLSCFVVDDEVAIDAGSLSFACSKEQKENIRDVILTHAHIDHIAGLPLFIDDLFSDLETPVRVHAAEEVIELLREHIFNWNIYPDFAELENEFGPVLEYRAFDPGLEFEVGGIRVKAIPVNHKVPSYGFVISRAGVTIALTGDTAEMVEFWAEIDEIKDLAALFVECAFPNRLRDLAEVSHHLTPGALGRELKLFTRPDCPVYAINLKPAYKEITEKEICELGFENLSVLEVGTPYEF